MAFCNSCGSSMEAGAKFCPKCGAAAVPGPSAAASSVVSIPPAPPAKSSSALKIILIILAVIIGLGILGMGTLAFVVHRVVSRSHMETGKDGSVKIDSPFGTVESTQDPEQAARNVGVDIYPGATVRKGGAANVSFGSIHSAAAEFESDDPVTSVADFYKAKFPGANIMSQGDRTTILAGQKGNMTTITIEPQDGKTRIHVAKVTNTTAGSSN